jgi:hypothetical protein
MKRRKLKVVWTCGDHCCHTEHRWKWLALLHYLWLRKTSPGSYAQVHTKRKGASEKPTERGIQGECPPDRVFPQK